MSLNKSLVIGLTGSIGSGKSSVSRLFAMRGYHIIDADVLARRAVEPGTKALLQLVERFGAEVLRADGTLDRAALAERAFATPEATAELNAIVHPAVIRLLNEELENAKARGEATIVLDVPLLFQTGLEVLCDCTVAVTAPPEIRLDRICRRDGLSTEQAQRRMNAQPPDIYYTQHATETVVNDSTEEALEQAVEALCCRLER